MHLETFIGLWRGVIGYGVGMAVGWYMGWYVHRHKPSVSQSITLLPFAVIRARPGDTTPPKDYVLVQDAITRPGQAPQDVFVYRYCCTNQSIVDLEPGEVLTLSFKIPEEPEQKIQGDVTA